MRIKILTLNIWNGGILLDFVIYFLKKEAPEIVILQEVYNGQDPKLEKRFRTVEVFKKELSFPYYNFSPAFMDTRRVGDIEEGNAIFSKFPIKNFDGIFFDIPYSRFDAEKHKDNASFYPRCMQHCVLDLDSCNINLFNVHGIWGFDGKDNKRRLEMSKIIVNEIKHKENAILAGDFNVMPNTRTIENIDRYLKNVFKGELTTTFNMKHKTNIGYATAVVDMIFVSKTMRVLDHYVSNVDVSDHLSLVCVLEIDG